MKYIKQCFDWNNDKINRKEWWKSLLLLSSGLVGIVIIFAILFGAYIATLLYSLLVIPYLYSFVNISRKRLKDIGISAYLGFILLIPTGALVLIILCGFIKTNYIHDINRKKLAKKILLTPLISSLVLILLWGIVAFISAMIGAEVGDLITKVIPFLLGLSIVMILPCLIVYLALKYK